MCRGMPLPVCGSAIAMIHRRNAQHQFKTSQFMCSKLVLWTMLYFTSFKLSAMILRPIRTSIGIHAFHPQRIRCIQTTGVVQGLPKPPALLKLTNEQENSEAMDWVTKFTASSTPIPRNLVELSFSRSSGPGGQVRWIWFIFIRLRRWPIIKNVNKVNTKATARCSVNSPWIPKWAVPALTTCVCLPFSNAPSTYLTLLAAILRRI